MIVTTDDIVLTQFGIPQIRCEASMQLLLMAPAYLEESLPLVPQGLRVSLYAAWLLATSKSDGPGGLDRDRIAGEPVLGDLSQAT